LPLLKWFGTFFFTENNIDSLENISDLCQESLLVYIKVNILPFMLDFCNFCQRPARQTVSNALLKSTNVQNNVLHIEK
jgi:hypothetical protein